MTNGRHSSNDKTTNQPHSYFTDERSIFQKPPFHANELIHNDVN